MTEGSSKTSEGGIDPITQIQGSLVDMGYSIDRFVSYSESTSRPNYSVHPALGVDHTSIDFFRDMEQITTQMGLKHTTIPKKLLVEVYYYANPQLKRVLIAAFFFSSEDELPPIHRHGGA
jgi:hypothetical protein